MVSPKYHIFVCTSCRINGQQKGFCYSKGAVDLVQRFMEEIDDRDLSGEVMITNTGCFGICDKGPIVVVYPEGVWYGNVTEDDVETIVEQHIEGGLVVESLVI
ncbi:2Fe-2S ferredoxin [Candidatus Galacturonibacter soehngenii]|uniref:(2Fe-2S) ferredoxin domain-containing protein n=1 Tax=Candidatus Galacturonatibacter soehngenii TaxID=2307010 RepID=A0A7V7UBK1_9FIRM|nr:2Fe-2S ferredoxin [Candidatus Galacturonibacter soehngenii]KAB1438183.1 (2Fe-2S) ferredoxin domain-containing protein [Candidatus Galacturonibacter soehngenii]